MTTVYNYKSNIIDRQLISWSQFRIYEKIQIQFAHVGFVVYDLSKTEPTQAI